MFGQKKMRYYAKNDCLSMCLRIYRKMRVENERKLVDVKNEVNVHIFDADFAAFIFCNIASIDLHRRLFYGTTKMSNFFNLFISKGKMVIS